MRRSEQTTIPCHRERRRFLGRISYLANRKLPPLAAVAENRKEIRFQLRPHLRQAILLISLFCGLVLLASSTQSLPALALGGATQPSTLTVVSAASFDPQSIAPGAILALFGNGLATQVVAAADTDPNQPGIQLPTTLAGVTVEVNGRRSQLYYVSPGQINFLLPAETQIGTASVVVSSPGGVVATGEVEVRSVAPAIFTAEGSGRGLPAALLLRLRSNGEQIYEPIADYDPSSQSFRARPIDFGPDLGAASDRLFLILFLSGLRAPADPNGDGNLNEGVQVIFGGASFVPDYAGAQGSFHGLDQINLEVSRSLAGRGLVNLSIAASGGRLSNQTEVEIASPRGTLPPQINNYAPSSILAGQTLTIFGAGFSANMSENLVRIGGVEARLTSANPTQLTVTVPFGAQTGPLTVRTPHGETARESGPAVQTSFSGFVEKTTGEPIPGVGIRILNTNLTAKTGANGSFVIANPPAGTIIFEVEGGQAQAVPPFPRVLLKMLIRPQRDNPYGRPLALQQMTGPSISVGDASNGADLLRQPSSVPSGRVETEGVAFELSDGAAARFPDGSTGGLVFLTRVQRSRTPRDFPPLHFSPVVVQLTPFGVKLNPGGKLVFPNVDNLPPGTELSLFRLDQQLGLPTLGDFIVVGTARVTADGQRIESENGAVTETSYYFVSRLRPTTTLIGRVVDFDGMTPVRGAVVTVHGQQSLTDGNGGFAIRDLPIPSDGELSVEAVYQRPSGRIDRTSRSSIPAVENGITQVVPDLVLPFTNLPPVIIAPSQLTVAAGSTLDASIIISDPDEADQPPESFASEGAEILAQGLRVSLSGPSFASLFGQNANLHTLRLAPEGFQTGDYSLTLTATDALNGVTQHQIGVRVTAQLNRAPVAENLSISLDEDTSAGITLAAIDPDGDPLSFIIVAPPAHGSLSGGGASRTYTPAPNYNGSDSFTFKATDGALESAEATISITVTPINDPPILSVPGTQSVDENQNLSFTVSATDVDQGQTLTLSASNLPTGASFNPATGQFSWTPNFTQAGSYQVLFGVQDNGTPPLGDNKSVTINVANSNQPPTANSQSVMTSEDNAVGMTLTGSDPDGDPLNFIIVTSPAHGNLSGSGASRTYSPALNYNGSDSFTFKVSDGNLESSPATVSISITPVNDPPTLSINPPGPFFVNAFTGSTVSFTVFANDLETLCLTMNVNIINPPAGSTFGKNLCTYFFNWTPTSLQTGSYNIQFTVSDSGDNGSPPLSAMATAQIMVTFSPPLQLPDGLKNEMRNDRQQSEVREPSELLLERKRRLVLQRQSKKRRRD
ncbi:MAG: tandem-95 repeat protein [Acidobacteria bacterium]|nr:tandem-95 repeat protein [Acidobacteriota bacterium]